MTPVTTMSHEDLRPVIKTAGASDSTIDFALLRIATQAAHLMADPPTIERGTRPDLRRQIDWASCLQTARFESV
jgi:hypothetical protein